MYSVYFVVSEHSLSDRIRSVIDFPRFDLQYFGTEYHSALALRLAIVAKPQIIVLDSDAPFISVSKFVSMLRENDVNCVLILLEGAEARHEPCPGIAAIRLDRNDLSPQRVQDAFRQAIAMADSRSAIRLTVNCPHQLPEDLLAYLRGGPLTAARLALLFPRTQWVNYYLTVLVFQAPVSDRQFQSCSAACAARLLFPYYLCRVSETELLLLSSKHVLPSLAVIVREIWPGAAHTFLSDYVTDPPQLPQATLQLLKYASCCRYYGIWDQAITKAYFSEHAEKVLPNDVDIQLCHILHAIFHHDLPGVRAQLQGLFFDSIANSLSMTFAQQVLGRFTELNYIFQKLDPDCVIRPAAQRVSLAADYDAVRQSLERCLAHTSSEMQTWNPIVIDAVFYACTNYHLKHTQSTAAHSVGISASYHCAVLKKSIGMTYIDLLTDVRIYHAKRLLAEDPTQRIHQVAAMVGFDDQRYFSKVFRRAAGCTPQQYAASIPRKEAPTP